MALRPYNLISVCAGVGGLDLGVQLAEPAARAVCYVEREAHAAAVLVARMEEGWLHPAPIWSDLRTFDAGAWRGAVDCFVSGDPCQGNSVAGKRLGEADDRWLADRVVECFDASGAHRLFRENVTGNAIGQLSYFVPALERLGCRVAVGIFSAKQLGFSHGRERLFIMADRPDLGHERTRSSRAGRYGFADGGRHLDDPQCSEWRALNNPCGTDGRDILSRRKEGPAWLGKSGEDLGHPDGLGRRAEGDSGVASENALQPGRGLPFSAPGPADPRWPDILARAPQLEPAVRRMADGMADRVDRLRACGNGVVPLVAGYAWRTLESRLAADAATGLPVLTEAA